MNRQGTVTKIDGKYVSISTQPLSCCSGEGSCSCMQSGKFVEFKAWNPKNLDLKVGDYVDVSNQSGESLLGLVRILLIPLGLFFVGYALWPSFAKDTNDAVRFGVAFVGLILGGAINLFFLKQKDQGLPVVEKVVPVMDIAPLTMKA